MPEELVFRSHFATSTEGRGELARLVRDVFEIDLTPLDRLGDDPDLVALGWWQTDRLVAGLCLRPQTLWLDREEIAGLDLEWVAVRPGWRGRGLFRDLLARALAEADRRVGLVTLTTATPALYRDAGFRAIAGSSFTGPLRPAGNRADRRRLSLADAADVATIRDLFARRTPVSFTCAVVDHHPAQFFLKAIDSPEIALVHLADLDAVVAIEEDASDTLVLLDVIAQEIPSLAEIAAALGGRARRARVFVTPDRLGWRPAEIVPEDDGWMVRGAVPGDRRTVALSPMRV